MLALLTSEPVLSFFCSVLFTLFFVVLLVVLLVVVPPFFVFSADSDFLASLLFNLFEMIVTYSPVSYMESERKFLIMHLCNLSQD